MNELNELDHQLTLAINGSDSLFWDNVMYTVTNTFSWSLVILTLLIIVFKNNNWKEALMVYLTIALLIFVADRLCSGIVKPTVARWRPTQDPHLMYFIDVVRNNRGGKYGFFSGHACNTMCMAVFLSCLFRSTKITVTLIFWSLTTTFTRLYLGVHYLGDVCVGFIVGTLLGLLFYWVMERYVHPKVGIRRLVSEQFTASGYMKSDMNILMTVIFFNYLCVIVFAMTLGIG
ncbi:MAG: phosphatase PAP2 family protein [Prevotellaceae bacterium]|nr:phosphatase PAP2 family protein [Prevotellaceae bacterium]